MMKSYFETVQIAKFRLILDKNIKHISHDITQSVLQSLGDIGYTIHAHNPNLLINENPKNPPLRLDSVIGLSILELSQLHQPPAKNEPVND